MIVDLAGESTQFLSKIVCALKKEAESVLKLDLLDKEGAGCCTQTMH
jgi:hypothetical protein